MRKGNEIQMNYLPIGFPRDLPLCSREFPICFSPRFGIRRDRREDRCCHRRVGSEASISHQRPLCAASWQPPDKNDDNNNNNNNSDRVVHLLKCNVQ